MTSLLKRWYLDVPDTRDWDLAEKSKSERRRIKAQCQSTRQRQIVAKILTRILEHHDDPAGLPSVLEDDYESILSNFGTTDSPVESAVLWALMIKEEKSNQTIPSTCIPNPARRAAETFCDTRRENSLRDILKTISQIDDCEPNNSLVSIGKDIQFFRLDRPFRSSKSKRLFGWVLACLAAKLPVLFTVPLMNIPMTSFIEKKGGVRSLKDTTYPIGQHPMVGFDTVQCADNQLTRDKHFILKFASAKKTARLISETRLGIRARNFLGDELGSNGFTIVPEWYFHLGLVRDCWVIIKPNEKYLDEAS